MLSTVKHIKSADKQIAGWYVCVDGDFPPVNRLSWSYTTKEIQHDHIHGPFASEAEAQRWAEKYERDVEA